MSFEDYVGELNETDRSFVLRYESSIRKFVDELKTDKNLKFITPEQKTRVGYLFNASNTMVQIYTEGVRLFKSENYKERLRNGGFDIDEQRLVQMWGVILCHMHQVVSEKLKLHLLLFVDFDKLITGKKKKTSPYVLPLGPLIGTLQKKYPNNDFVDYLNTNIRNAVAHYTYFFDGDYLFLCNGWSDPEPMKISVQDFITRFGELNRLDDAFCMLVADSLGQQLPWKLV